MLPFNKPYILIPLGLIFCALSECCYPIMAVFYVKITFLMEWNIDGTELSIHDLNKYVYSIMILAVGTVLLTAV